MTPTVAAPFTRDILRTVLRNAGRVPKEKLAADTGLSVTHIERLAREHDIDLRVPPAQTPFDLAQRIQRTEQLTVRLFPADRAAIEQIARDLNVAPGRVVSSIIEHARARDMLLDLVRPSAPIPIAPQDKSP